MGLNPGSRARGKRLADMSGHFEEVEQTYRRPEGAEQRDDPAVMDIGDGHYIHSESWFLRGKIVWFVLAHYYKPTPTSDGVPVTRVDCCGNTVHQHRYNAAGEDLLDHRVISEIPLEDPGNAVHDAYDEAWGFVVDDAEANVELWRRTL